MINLTCPSCSTAYELPDEDAGTQAECACGQVLDIVPQEAPAGAIPVVCDGCGAQYELGLEDAGTQVECPCGHVITVPSPGETPVADGQAAAASIPVTCPGCSSQYELALEDAGTQVECPCGTVITVPASGETTTDTATTPPTTWNGPIPVQCPGCGAAYELPPEEAGTQAECACGQVLDIPASPPAEAEPPAEAAAESEAVQPSIIPVTCSSCGAAYELGLEDAGTEAQCACGATIVVPDAPPAADGKKSKRKRSVEIQRPDLEKKKSWRGPAIMGGGTLVLIIALTTVLILKPGQRSAGTPKDSVPELVVPEGRERADPATWEGWVNESTVAVMIVRPKQMLAAPLLKDLPAEFMDGLKTSGGFDASHAEEIVVILDAPAEETQPPRAAYFLRFSEETKSSRLRTELLNGLLPDGETVSTKTENWFRGQTQGLFFPDNRVAVLAEAEFLAERIPKRHQRLVPDNALFKQIEEARRSNDIDAYFSDAAFAMLPESEESLGGQLKTLTFSLSLSSSSLLDVTATASDVAAAEAVEKKVAELKTSLAGMVEQSVASLPTAATTEDPQLGALAKSLVDGIKVYRTETSLNLQLRVPYTFADSLKQASQELVALKSLLPGAAPTTVAAAPNADQPKAATTQAAASAESLKPPSAVRFPIAPDERFRVYDKAQEKFMAIFGEADQLNQKIAEAEQEEKQPLRAQRWKKLREAAGVMREAERLAVKLADGTGDMEKLLQARYLLSYIYSQLNMHYEAGLLGAWVAENDGPDSKRALQSAFVSLSSWQNAYTEAPGNARDGEREEFVSIASVLNDGWPDEPQLDQIRYTVGQILQLDGEYEPAATWFSRVSDGDARYPEAQIAAGQAYWRRYKALLKEAKKWRDEHATEPAAAQVHISAGEPVEPPSAGPETEPSSEPGAAAEPDSTDGASSTPAPAPENGVETEPVPEDDSSSTAGTEPAVEDELSVNLDEQPDALGDAAPDEEPPPEAPVADTQPSPAPAAVTDPYTERLDRLFGLADQHLEIGVALMQKRSEPPPPEEESEDGSEEPAAKTTETPAAGEPVEPVEPQIPPAPAEIVAAKITLADIRLRKGNAAGAVELLTVDPWSVMTAITVEDEEKRPESGVQSRGVATIAYQLLLRAAVAERQLDKAREVMETLEVVAGANDARRLTAVYLQLGEELMEELEAADEEHAAEVRSAFGEFLSVMAERKQQTFSSLLWIAETSTSLGESEETLALSQQMHGRAVTAYKTIIARAGEDRSFCSAKTVSAIRIRMAKSMRRAGQYDDAIQIFAGLLTLNPNSYSMQFEAAGAIEEWGRDTDDKDRLLEAVRGRGDALWGWSRISVTLQRRIEGGDPKPEYRDMMLEARYHVADCHRQWALAQDDKKEGLEKALGDIRTSAQLADSLDGEWWDRLDELYQSIQKELKPNETPKSIRVEFAREPETTGPETPDSAV